MIRHFFLMFLLVLIFGCAQFNDERYLEFDSASEWKIKQYKDWYYLSHQCESGEVNINFQKTLESDGDAYFIFYVVPLPPGKIQDKEYRGIDMFVRYSDETGIECKRNGALLFNSKNSYSPKSIKYIDEKMTSCLINWDYPADKTGNISINLSSTKNCSIPPVNFIYKSGHRYKYESIQG